MVPHLAVFHFLVRDLPDNGGVGEGGERSGIHPSLHRHDHPVVVRGVASEKPLCDARVVTIPRIGRAHGKCSPGGVPA